MRLPLSIYSSILGVYPLLCYKYMKPNQRYYLLSSLTSIMNHWTRAELVSLLSFPDGSKAMIKQVHLNISYILINFL